MSKSVDRVAHAAAKAGLTIEIKRMGESTRTAEEAARQCGCDIAQIVKSLVFAGKSSGTLYLFLVSGNKQLDIRKAGILAGEDLVRADARQVRDETGFAIGGVAPLGHSNNVRRYADRTLLGFSEIWAAAGAHDAVFSAEPKALIEAAGAELADIAAPAAAAD